MLGLSACGESSSETPTPEASSTPSAPSSEPGESEGTDSGLVKVVGAVNTIKLYLASARVPKCADLTIEVKDGAGTVLRVADLPGGEGVSTGTGQGKIAGEDVFQMTCEYSYEAETEPSSVYKVNVPELDGLVYGPVEKTLNRTGDLTTVPELRVMFQAVDGL